MGDGCNTWEYRQFRSNLSLLTDLIIDDLPDVAKELHAKVLISSSNKRKAMNQHNDDTIRASGLTQILLDAISLDKTKFYTIGHIFDNIEALQVEPKRSAILKIFTKEEVKDATKQTEEATDNEAATDTQCHTVSHR